MAAITPAPLIVVVGETASGKSELAMHLAQRYDGELICADSWTIYQDMNIGTAKPSAEDRRLVPHHLLDVTRPDDDFTVVDFQELAQQAIEDIAGRSKQPIMVGGNGLYVDSVLFNYSFLPVGDPYQRERLSNMTLEELYEEANLKQIDLTGIDRHNKRRVVRAIEAEGQRPGSSPLRDNTLIMGLRRSKQEMRERVEVRVEKMFAQGLPHEVKALAEQYGWETEAMKGIGYREFQGYFEGEVSKNEVKRRIVRSTIKLAKKQRSWFKRNLQIKWIESKAEAIELVENFLPQD